MFEKFPKTRPSLPKKIADIYASHYKLNRDGETSASSLAQKMESWMHRQISKDIDKSKKTDKKTLELGAGTLNQLQYEPDTEVYDIVEPFKSLFEDSPLLSRIRNVYGDISEIPENYRYDRIISVATLEHICNLPEVVAKSGLMLTQNGSFRASIPSEGTFLWTLGWKMTTGLEFKYKYGLDYGILMKHEHVNTAKEIEDVLRYFFKDVKGRSFGLGKTISLYQFYECQSANIERCLSYLKTIKS